MQTNGTGPHSPVRGTPRKVTTINGGKGRQWSNGEWRTSRAAALPGSRTQVILPEFLALFRQWTMENITLFMLPAPAAHPPRKTCLGNGSGQWINGEWRWRTPGEPGDASHFITDYCLAGGMGNGEWRKISASCFPGQGSWGNNQLGAANAPSSAMEWTMAPGKMESNL